MRVRVLLLLPVMLLSSGLVGGCGGTDSSDTATDGPQLEPPFKAYFEAVASYRVDSLAAAQVLAQEGSPAMAYLRYLGDFSASAVAAGQPVEPAVLEQLEDNALAGLTACGGTGTPEECVTWADFEGKAGKLTDFTVNGTKLDDSLLDLTDQPPVESAGVYTVQPDYAYRSPQSRSLFVLVTITASGTSLAPKPGTYVEGDQILTGVETRAPATIAAGTGSPVVLAFPDAEDAELDGQVTFDLGIPGAGVESIGFGLADPS